MSVAANKARLAAATQSLAVQWEQTQEHWKDVKSQEFDEKYMEQLLISVNSAMDVIDQLDKLVNKIRNDCE